MFFVFGYLCFLGKDMIHTPFELILTWTEEISWVVCINIQLRNCFKSRNDENGL